MTREASNSEIVATAAVDAAAIISTCLLCVRPPLRMLRSPPTSAKPRRGQAGRIVMDGATGPIGANLSARRGFQARNHRHATGVLKDRRMVLRHSPGGPK